MHIPSETILSQMALSEAGLWPAVVNDGEQIVLIQHHGCLSRRCERSSGDCERCEFGNHEKSPFESTHYRWIALSPKPDKRVNHPSTMKFCPKLGQCDLPVRTHDKSCNHSASMGSSELSVSAKARIAALGSPLMSLGLIL